ncbi:protein of unknown function [Methylocaldum szegediense]|uniref:Uncharacterized protein n=1 Tax=Methylocaldum szegediense TaxID=73780 RepID=A0ABM9HW31_9GAMM|nr:protein of unknown function [Methylocaldum szegediense]
MGVTSIQTTPQEQTLYRGFRPVIQAGEIGRAEAPCLNELRELVDANSKPDAVYLVQRGSYGTHDDASSIMQMITILIFRSRVSFQLGSRTDPSTPFSGRKAVMWKDMNGIELIGASLFGTGSLRFTSNVGVTARRCMSRLLRISQPAFGKTQRRNTQTRSSNIRSRIMRFPYRSHGNR